MNHQDDISNPIEQGIPNNQLTFQETDDFGAILKILRENQGYTIVRMSKMLSLATDKISRIERSLSELPSEVVLRKWLSKLGCKDNLRQLMTLARQHRVVHYLRLHSKDESNADMIRILDAYRDQKLTPLDRALLGVISRD
jgi:transcriptional regulator with XRE-family HTH domain